MSNALLDSLMRFTSAQLGQSPFVTPIPGLTILRSDHEKRPDDRIFKPALCVVVQGAKWAIFGDRRIHYKAGQALVVSVETPAFGTVAEASPSEPYLGIILEFDLAIMREVMEDMEDLPKPENSLEPGVFVAEFGGALEECMVRMVRLLETPKAISMLYPSVMREICYWLLTGAHAAEIARMVLASGHDQRLLGAIHSLRDRFDHSVRIEELAGLAGMSPSAFHRQFKALTSMTPLQYQKQLRLIEARRLLASSETNVETAAFRVGYESASQFSREYARMFGAPPRRDTVQMRAALA